MKNTELRTKNLVALSEKVRTELYHNEVWAQKDFFKVETIYGDGDISLELDDEIVDFDINEVEPIPLTEEWLLRFGFEKWDNVEVNEYEYYERYVLYNVIGGTSNFEVHIIHNNYSSFNETEIIYSIDIDERMSFIENTEFVHTLQNTYALTGKELEINQPNLKH